MGGHLAVFRCDGAGPACCCYSRTGSLSTAFATGLQGRTTANHRRSGGHCHTHRDLSHPTSASAIIMLGLAIMLGVGTGFTRCFFVSTMDGISASTLAYWSSAHKDTRGRPHRRWRYISKFRLWVMGDLRRSIGGFGKMVCGRRVGICGQRFLALDSYFVGRFDQVGSILSKRAARGP